MTLTSGQKKNIQYLLRRDWPYKQVAKHVGCSISSVAIIAKNKNLAPSRRKEFLD